MNHFDEMTAFLYLDGQLENAQSSDVLAHTKQCGECRALLESLKRETIWIEQSLQEKDPVPAQFVAPARRANVRWGWITALGIAAAGILTVWNGIIEPLQQQLNQAGFSGGNLMTMLFFSGAFFKGWPSVLSFVEFFAMAMVIMLMFIALQRFWRRGASFGIALVNASFLGLLFSMLLMVPSAHASKVIRGHHLTYTLPAGQTVNTDLFVFANFTRIDGTVNGDLYVWSNEVEINGHVTGDVIAFSRETRVNGTIDGNIRSYSQTLNINGNIGKNVLVGCELFEMGSTGKVGGSVTLGSANAMIAGAIARDITAAAGDATLNGSVGGDVKLRGDNLHIGPDANVKGALSYRGRNPASVDPQAKLASPLVFTQLKTGPDYESWPYYRHRVEFWAAAFLFGLVLVLVVPRFFARGLETSKNFLPSFGFGILFLIATPIVAAIVCITLVGLPLGIATFLLWLIAVYASQVFVASWLGDILLGSAIGTGALLARLALGLAILHGLEMAPYHVGGIIHFVVLCWGLGSIVMAIFGYLRRGTSPAPVPAV